MITRTAPIAEIFFSYQGEGVLVGQPQVFLRFSGCNLRCSYCDTRQTQRVASHHRHLSVAEVSKAVQKVAVKIPRGYPKSISLTGGEPLLHADFLAELIPVLRKQKMQIYLETNGTLPEPLARLMPLIDVVSMDIKPPSASKKALWQQHALFLRTAGKKAFVKLVVGKKTTEGEIKKAIKVIASVSKDIPLIIQPVTPSKCCAACPPERINRYFTLARKTLATVAILPQMHKIWKIK